MFSSTDTAPPATVAFRHLPGGMDPVFMPSGSGRAPGDAARKVHTVRAVQIRRSLAVRLLSH